MPRDRSPIEDLRLAIDCLPLRTRVAMLEGIRSNEIIVGAYTDRDGGVCPMLAAHRCGGRTNFISFARRGTASRPPSAPAGDPPRGPRCSRPTCEASCSPRSSIDLAAAIADHTSSPVAGRAEPEMRPGDPGPLQGARSRHGLDWLRPFRRLDEYERALARVEAERDRASRARARAGLEPVARAG